MKIKTFILLTTFNLLTIAAFAQGQQLSLNELNFREKLSNALIEYTKENYFQAKQLALGADSLKSSAAVYFLLYQIASSQENWDKSLLYIQKAVELDSTNPWYLYFLAQTYTTINETQKAKETLEKFIENQSNYEKAYYDLINLSVRTNDFQDAIKYIDLYEENFGIKTNLAKYKLNLLTVSSSKNVFFKNLKKYRTNNIIGTSDYFLSCAKFFFFRKQYAQTLSCLDSTERISKDVKQVFRAAVLLEQNKFQESAKLLSRTKLSVQSLNLFNKNSLEKLLTKTSPREGYIIAKKFYNAAPDTYRGLYQNFLLNNLAFDALDSLLKRSKTDNSLSTWLDVKLFQKDFSGLKDMLINCNTNSYYTKAKCELYKAFINKQAGKQIFNVNLSDVIILTETDEQIYLLLKGKIREINIFYPQTAAMANVICNKNCINKNLKKYRTETILDKFLYYEALKKAGKNKHAQKVLKELQETELIEQLP